MSSEIDEFRSSLVAAVQAELERHANAVVAEVDRLREEGRKERTALRNEFNEHLKALTGGLDQANARRDAQAEKQRTAFNQRLSESEARQTRRLDDMAKSLDGLVRAAAAPLMQEMRDEQGALIHKVDGLDANLRKFDEQAARMVTYFNDVSQSMERRQDELSEALKVDIADRLDTVQSLVEENDAAIRAFKAEVGQTTSQKINDAEDRFSNRLLGAESRMNEDAGQKIADIGDRLDTVQSLVEENDAAIRTFKAEVGQTTSQKINDAEDRFNTRLLAAESRMNEDAGQKIADIGDRLDTVQSLVEENDAAIRTFKAEVGQTTSQKINDAEDRFNTRLLAAESRMNEDAGQKIADIGDRLDTVQTLVEENDAAIRTFKAEVGQTTSQKINDAEDRFNTRLLAAESRMKEDAGQKIAEIDAHVGRVGTSLDDTMLVLNDRIAGLDSRFVESDRRIDGIEQSIEGVDAQALDDLKERMSTAVGEAMLVRIEMERLAKSTNERTDSLTVRMTDVETQVQDATLDVSTAVQLDRLEEIERALIELDPSQFVRKDQDTVKKSSADAEAVSDSSVASSGFAGGV